MTFDRSKLKGTKLGALRQQKEELEAKQPRNSNRPGFLDIDEGKNIFRIYPGTLREDGEQDPFIFAKSGFFLPIWEDDTDDRGVVKKDNNDNPIRILKQKFIFDARIHGDLEKDIVQEYINMIFQIAFDDFQDPDKRTEFLEPLKGNFKKKVNGILNRTTWICYADKLNLKAYNEGDYTKKKFGRLELKKSVQDAMNVIADIDDVNDPMGTEPFTDPDEGCPISIKRDKDNNDPGKKYLTSLLHKTPIRLTDEEGEAWSKLDSLSDMFGPNVYRRKDFEYALEGLKNFDESVGYDEFANEAFTDKIEELSSMVPFDQEEEEKDDSKSDGEDLPESTKNKVLTEDFTHDHDAEEPEDEQHDISTMNKSQLKAYIKECEMPIVVKTTDTPASLRKKILTEIAAGDAEENQMPWDNKESEEKHQETIQAKKAEEKVEEKTTLPSKGADRLAKFREKMKR